MVPGKRRALCAAVCILLCLMAAAARRGRAPEVRMPSAHLLEAEEDKELVYVMNLNLRYLLGDWWNGDKPYVFYHGSSYIDFWGMSPEQEKQIRKSAESFRNWREEKTLFIPLPAEDEESTENAIRPLSHAAYCIAASLRFGYFDEEITGVTAEDARQMCTKLVASAARIHAANRRGGWGLSWQSPLWAENLGFAAWLLWDDFTAGEKRALRKMILAESSMVLEEIPLDYYRNADGEILHEGDSKGEELAWFSQILALSSVMFPEEENAGRWKTKLTQLLTAAASVPGDAGSGAVVDGLAVSDFLGGSNLESDGSVINHGKVHIDYMTTICAEMAESLAVFLLAEEPLPEAALFHMDLLYACLANQDLGAYDPAFSGHHFYERDGQGRASADINMPGENDWGMNWFASCYLCDVVAKVFHLDQDFPEGEPSASEWADLHLSRVREMTEREDADGLTAGQIFREGENSFVSGDFFQMHNLTEAWILQAGTRNGSGTH